MILSCDLEEVFPNTNELYRYLIEKPPKNVVPTSSMRSFSERTKVYLSGRFIEILKVSDKMAAEWLVNHYKQRPNTVPQSPVSYKGELFASISQFYRSVKCSGQLILATFLDAQL